MQASLRALSIALLLMLVHTAAAADSEDWGTELADCQPETLPDSDANATIVTLQMHQWVWIENLTAPDWGPRSNSGPMYYEMLKPGFVMNQTVSTITLTFTSVNVSFVTNGESLCASALTEYRNWTAGGTNRVSCSRVCHQNFTSTKTRLNLPLMVLDDRRTMTRYSEYLVFDAVDPDSRTAYTCMGSILFEPMADLPKFMTRERKCAEGDVCLFNYDTISGLVAAGCQNQFRYGWCMSDLNLCTFNIDGDCPVCCRGDLCNKEVAQRGYQRWLDGFGSTIRPTPKTTPKAASSVASSLWMLGTALIGLFIAALKS